MKMKNIEPRIKLTFEAADAGSDSAFGPGVAALCEGVRETGSLNAAAKNMHMAYSKAWRIMKDTEQALGIQLLVRDGAHGSTLTEECSALLDAYHRMYNELIAQAEKSFSSAFLRKAE